MSARIQRHESWRERLLSLATVTATTALIWIWASGQTRQTAEANCRIHFIAASTDTQRVGPEEPISVRIQFSGSSSAVEAAVNAVNGRVFDLPVGTLGIPADAGGHEVALAEVIAAMSAIEESGASVRSVQPPIANLAVESIMRREARLVVRPAQSGALTRARCDTATVAVWLPSALADKLPEALVAVAAAPHSAMAEIDVSVQLPPEVAAIVGRVRIEPATVRLRAGEP